MTGGLTAERVRQDVGVVARAGLDLESFLVEAAESVARAVPWVGACVATHDPVTHLLTSARKYGDLAGRNDHDHEFGVVEYGSTEETAFTEMARAGHTAAGVHLVTDGEVERSFRMASYMTPHFGYADEARVLFRDGRHVWGAMAVFRGPEDRPFDAAEVEFLASLTVPFAQGVRSGILARLASAETGVPADLGPAVLIVNGADEIMQVTPAVGALLDTPVEVAGRCDPLSPVTAVVAAARRYGRGESVVPPRSRVRTASGRWVVLQAGPLDSASGHAGDVVVTVEEARPPDIVGLVVSAFGLTDRERDITQLVLQGMDTKAIAHRLHLSAYTIQDHLKAIFTKADVRSRRELISRVYFDQYVPRMGDDLSPSGWFT